MIELLQLPLSFGVPRAVGFGIYSPFSASFPPFPSLLSRISLLCLGLTVSFDLFRSISLSASSTKAEWI